jgi:esterase/lipase superfamily enzyme
MTKEDREMTRIDENTYSHQKTVLMYIKKHNMSLEEAIEQTDIDSTLYKIILQDEEEWATSKELNEI